MSAKKLLWLLPLLLLIACEDGRHESGNSSAEPASSETADSSMTAGAPGALASPTRKVVRTADFHCKVLNVLNAVTSMEQQVKAVGGIIEESNIGNNSGGMKDIYYKSDSLKHVQVYTTTAYLTLRVPSQMLDSIVNSIPSATSFIESRKIGQRDVTLKYLSNELLNKPGDTKTKVARALQVAEDARDVIEVQRYDDGRRERTISRQLENLQLMDNVSYATLTVSFTQPDQVFTQVIANPEYMMRTPFTTRLNTAMLEGFELIGNIIIGLMTIWPILCLILTGVTIGLLVLRQRRKMRYAN